MTFSEFRKMCGENKNFDNPLFSLRIVWAKLRACFSKFSLQKRRVSLSKVCKAKHSHHLAVVFFTMVHCLLLHRLSFYSENQNFPTKVLS